MYKKQKLTCNTQRDDKKNHIDFQEQPKFLKDKEHHNTWCHIMIVYTIKLSNGQKNIGK
jgi:hypothetical protein